MRNKVIFCDIGGVLLNNGWGHESREKAADFFGIDYTEMSRRHDSVYNVYETGGITIEEYLDTAVFHQHRAFSKKDFISFMFNQSVQLPFFKEWLFEVRKNNFGVKIIAINNEGKEVNDCRIDKFNLHLCFDAFVSSCDVGIRKPDPEIFRLALKIAHIKTEHCIFFDDRPLMVEAASRIGIKSYHHQNFETSKKIIQNFINEK